MQALLLNLGIYAKLGRGAETRESRRTPYIVSIVHAESRARFRDLIGFVSDDKREKLDTACSDQFAGKKLPALRDETVVRVECVGVQPVFDIQTESGQYLSNNVIVHNCFIQSVSDDLVNDGGIMDLWTREARIFKYGSGTGTNFSNLRGENEPLSGGGKSSGLMSFLKIGDRAAGAIKSGGTTRRAAKMVILDLDHPDILEFIRWKVVEEQKVAALVSGSRMTKRRLQAVLAAVAHRRRASRPTRARTRRSARRSARRARPWCPRATSSACCSWPPRACARSTSRSTTPTGTARPTTRSPARTPTTACACPTPSSTCSRAGASGSSSAAPTASVADAVPAEQLWDEIAYAAWACADPGVQYDTTINEWHTCPEDGRINASNPCVTGDTLVATAEGWQRIDALVGKTARIIGSTASPTS